MLNLKYPLYLLLSIPNALTFNLGSFLLSKNLILTFFSLFSTMPGRYFIHASLYYGLTTQSYSKASLRIHKTPLFTCVAFFSVIFSHLTFQKYLQTTAVCTSTPFYVLPCAQTSVIAAPYSKLLLIPQVLPQVLYPAILLTLPHCSTGA